MTGAARALRHSRSFFSNAFGRRADPGRGGGILDYALPQAKALCEDAEEATGGSLRCRFVDMVPVFEGHPEYINDDIHPNALGGRVMAEKIWEVMEDHCLGQKGIHDCCEP